LRLLRRFSATLARAFAACRVADGEYLGGGAISKSLIGDLGLLNTSRCEICGQTKHLNVWRSNATSDVGSPRCSTCLRRISARHAGHFIAVLPLVPRTHRALTLWFCQGGERACSFDRNGPRLD